MKKKRGISIQSTPVSFNYNDVKINLIDTPGHVEFVAEVERAMSVLDGAVLVISAKEGVQSHTILLFESLKKLGKPIIFFINKMDRSGVNKNELLESIKADLCGNIVEIQSVEKKENQIHIGGLFDLKSIIDDITMYDDNLLERYLNDEEISKQDIENSIRTRIQSQTIFPVCYGSALNNTGIKELLDVIYKLLPKLAPVSEGPLEGVVFKIVRNPQGKREIYIRLYQGSIRSREVLNDEKISFIKQMVNGKLEFVKEACGNDIVVLMGPDKLRVGDVIGNPKDYKKNIVRNTNTSNKNQCRQ